MTFRLSKRPPFSRTHFAAVARRYTRFGSVAGSRKLWTPFVVGSTALGVTGAIQLTVCQLPQAAPSPTPRINHT